MKILFFHAPPSAFTLSETHSLTSVVLPKPAGAETRVMPGGQPEATPSFSRSIRRGRRTIYAPRGDVEFRG